MLDTDTEPYNIRLMKTAKEARILSMKEFQKRTDENFTDAVKEIEGEIFAAAEDGYFSARIENAMARHPTMVGHLERNGYKVNHNYQAQPVETVIGWS